MRVSPLERIGFAFAFLICEAISLWLASHQAFGWYFVAAVFLALIFLVLTLPAKTPEMVPLASAELPVTGPGHLYAVPVRFLGETALVFNRLQADGWKFGGSGPFLISKGKGVVTLEIAGPSADRVRRAAGRAVRNAGALVEGIGAAELLR